MKQIIISPSALRCFGSQQIQTRDVLLPNGSRPDSVFAVWRSSTVMSADDDRLSSYASRYAARPAGARS